MQQRDVMHGVQRGNIPCVTHVVRGVLDARPRVRHVQQCHSVHSVQCGVVPRVADIVRVVCRRHS